MATFKTSLSFGSLPDADLVEFTDTIITKMTGNPAFTTPAVPLPVLTTKKMEFLDSIVAASQGGLGFTAAKDAERDELLPLLRTQASYVQTVSNDDAAVILSSGFSVNSTNRTSAPLAKPSIDVIENNASTQLLVKVTTIPNARAYEVRINSGDGKWVNAGVFTKSRYILLENLTPGSTYTIQVRAVGGKTGYSDWSDPVSHMSL